MGPAGNVRWARIEPGLEVFSRPMMGITMLLLTTWYLAARQVNDDLLEIERMAIKQAVFLDNSRSVRDE